jgi:hypothetical protein
VFGRGSAAVVSSCVVSELTGLKQIPNYIIFIVEAQLWVSHQNHLCSATAKPGTDPFAVSGSSSWKGAERGSVLSARSMYDENDMTRRR